MNRSEYGSLKYPEWAPQYLCDMHNIEHQKQCEKEADKTSGDLVLDKMVGQSGNLDYDHEMECVWMELGKKHPTDSDYFDLFYLLIQASAEPNKWDISKKKSQRVKLDKINKLARKLLIELRDTPLDRSPYLYYSNHMAKSLLDVINPKKYPVISHRENPQLGLDTIFAGNPKVSDVMWRLAKVAESELDVLRGDSPLWKPEVISESPLKNPGMGRAHAARFVYYVSNFISIRFNDPPRVVVERLARVMLEDPEINPDFVGRHSWEGNR